MGNGTLLFGNVVTLLESSSCKIMIQLLQNLFLRVSVQRLCFLFINDFYIYMYFIVDIQSLGQEEDAPPPEPFEWDPNDE